jgi:hypothetical protein
MHPGVNNLTELTENQLEQKILKLNSMYFLSDNSEVRQQIILLLDTYKLELQERRILQRLKSQEDGNNELDNLINVN